MTRISSHPPVGMYFNDARKRAVRIAKNKSIDPLRKNQLVESLKNQSRLHDGQGAHDEIAKEIDIDTNNHSQPRTGYSKQYAESYEKIFGGTM